MQNAYRAHVVDAAFNGAVQGFCLFVAAGNDHHFLGIHNGGNADGQDVSRYQVGIVVKKAGVGFDGVFV